MKDVKLYRMDILNKKCADCFEVSKLNVNISLVYFQDQLIPNSAWKDYSSNTNYAFDAFSETEEKQKRGGRSASTQQTLQMSHSPAKGQYYSNEGGRSSRHDNSAGGDNHRGHYQNGGDNGRGYQNGDHVPRSSYADRTYSLPRTVVQQQQQLQQKHPGYYTQDRRNRNTHHHSGGGGGGGGGGNAAAAANAGIDTPDFYFMPSQRKYSGEVVRVYVDYNKDPKN